MRKVIPLLLMGVSTAAGCAIFPDNYDDPFASHIDFGKSYGTPMYYWPVSYTYGCRGYYGPNGSCVHYHRSYVAAPRYSPEEEPVIPETQPRVMATGDPWSYTVTDDMPQTMRGRMYREPGLSSDRRMVRPEPRFESRPTTSSRSVSPPRRSTPRQAPTRSKSQTREPEHGEEMR